MDGKCMDIGMTVCMWCQKENGVAIAKTLKNCGSEGKVPKRFFNGYEPCSECQKMWDTGVALLEAEEEPQVPDQPPIQEGVYPTGNHWVIATGAAEEMFPEHKGQKVMLIQKALAVQLGLYAEQNEKEK